MAAVRLELVIGFRNDHRNDTASDAHPFLDQQAGGRHRGLRVEGDEHLAVPVDPLAARRTIRSRGTIGSG